MPNEFLTADWLKQGATTGRRHIDVAGRPFLRATRPVAYPTVVVVGFVLLLVDSTGISLFAALRPLIVLGAAALAFTFLVTFVLGDRDAAGLVALALLLVPAVLQSQLLTLLLPATAALLVVSYVAGRSGRSRFRWSMFTRAMTIAAWVMVLAVGIRALQDGRLVQELQGLSMEGPFRPHDAAPATVSASTPDIYLFMLDGYPRADKLQSTFGIDNTVFIRDLESREFSVAPHSRSNYLQTHLTLMSLLNGSRVQDLIGAGASDAEQRGVINAARALLPFEEAGYQTVAISSGFEGVSLRRVDRFIDTGQLNEFERVLVQSTILPAVLALDPSFLVDDHVARVRANLDRAEQLAREQGPARFVFVHVAAPHSPVALGPDGASRPDTTDYNFLDDREQALRLGRAAYSDRLRGELQFLNRRVLDVVDAIAESGRPAVVAVFSDHGSGVEFSTEMAAIGEANLDLRSANLLAVRGVGSIDDHSTLLNLIPRIAHRVFGSSIGTDLKTTWSVSDDLSQFEEYVAPDR